MNIRHHIRLTLFSCVIAEGVPKLLEHNELVDSRRRYLITNSCPADTEILKQIQKNSALRKTRIYRHFKGGEYEVFASQSTPRRWSRWSIPRAVR